MNTRLLDALAGKNEGRPPVWFMRQAGRFLPVYQDLRKRHSLNELFRNPSLAAKITQMPLDVLDVDAAILFSDILVLGEIFGYGVHFPEGGGIHIENPVKKIRLETKSTLSYVKETIEILKPTLKVPLIGFCGGPYTVAKYLSCINPDMLKHLADASIEYLQMQIEAGVDAIQIFDSWSGLLEEEQFHTLALPYLKKIVDAIRPSGIPIIVFCRNSTKYTEELISLNPSAISFDEQKPMHILKDEVPEHIGLQGNLSPEVLSGPIEILKTHVEEILLSMKGQKRFIFNLGHGVLPKTPVENAIAVVRWINHI